MFTYWYLYNIAYMYFFNFFLLNLNTKTLLFRNPSLLLITFFKRISRFKQHTHWLFCYIQLCGIHYHDFVLMRINFITPYALNSHIVDLIPFLYRILLRIKTNVQPIIIRIHQHATNWRHCCIHAFDMDK